MKSKEGELVVAPTPELEIIGKRLADLAAETNWDLPVHRGVPLAGKDLQQWLLDREERALKDKIERGVGYMLLKRELGHGGFTGWLDDHGLAYRTVAFDMKISQLLMSMSPSNAIRGSHLPKRKLRALSQLPAEVVDELFEDGVIDEDDSKSLEEIEQIVKLRKDYANLQMKNQNLAMQIDKLREEGNGVTSEWVMPVRRAREEAVIHGTQAVSIADDLSKELAMLYDAVSAGVVDEAGKIAAVSAVYFAAQQASHRFTMIVNDIIAYYDGFSEEDIKPLDELEVRRVDSAVEFLVSTFRNASDARENNRRNTAPGRRGRKAGAAKKG